MDLDAGASVCGLCAARLVFRGRTRASYQSARRLEAHRRRGARDGSGAGSAPTPGRRIDRRRGVPRQPRATCPGTSGAGRSRRRRVPSARHRLSHDRRVRCPRHLSLAGGGRNIPTYASRRARHDRVRGVGANDGRAAVSSGGAGRGRRVRSRTGDPSGAVGRGGDRDRWSSKPHRPENVTPGRGSSNVDLAVRGFRDPSGSRGGLGRFRYYSGTPSRTPELGNGEASGRSRPWRGRL
jgi:hypothetical protein